jgi:hypothetical protein
MCSPWRVRIKSNRAAKARSRTLCDAQGTPLGVPDDASSLGNGGRERFCRRAAGGYSSDWCSKSQPATLRTLEKERGCALFQGKQSAGGRRGKGSTKRLVWGKSAATRPSILLYFFNASVLGFGSSDHFNPGSGRKQAEGSVNRRSSGRIDKDG